MLKNRGAAVALAALLALGGYAGFVAASNQHQQTIKINSEQKSDRPLEPERRPEKPQTYSGKIIFTFPNTIAAELYSRPNEQGEYSANEGTEYWPPVLGLRLKITDSLLALFTFLLFVATVFLGWATVRLWNTARDDFYATHRPRLRIRRVSLDGFMSRFFQSIMDGQKLECLVSVSNIGNSVATVVGGRYRIYFRERLPIGRYIFDGDELYITQTPLHIPPGANRRFTLIDMFPEQAWLEGGKKFMPCGLTSIQTDSDCLQWEISGIQTRLVIPELSGFVVNCIATTGFDQ